MDWSRKARETIAAVHSGLPEDATFKDRKAAVFAAYPFGERAYWPYKAWCKARGEYLKQYDPKAPAPPLLRDLIAKDRPDITFPFSPPQCRMASMASRASRFKQSDLTRAVKGVEAAGMRVGRVEIDANGNIVILSEASAPKVGRVNSWDEELGR